MMKQIRKSRLPYAQASELVAPQAVDGVWTLVRAQRECNRGEGGVLALVPVALIKSPGDALEIVS